MSSPELWPRQYDQETSSYENGGSGTSSAVTAIYANPESTADAGGVSTIIYYSTSTTAGSGESTALTTANTQTASLSASSVDVLTKLGSPIWISSTSSATTSTPTTSATPTTAATSTTTAANTNAAEAAPGAYSGSLSTTKAKLAVAIPVSVVGLLGLIALLFFLLRRRQRQRARPVRPAHPAHPSFDSTTSQTTAMSTSELVAVSKLPPPDPVTVSLPKVPPTVDAPVPDTRDGAHSPSGSTIPLSPGTLPNGSQTEIGIAVAVPMDQRRSATAENLRRFSRPMSVASVGLAPQMRMPFQNSRNSRVSEKEAEVVSVISGLNEHQEHERDFDDMSSVSSLSDNDDDAHEPHAGHGNRPLR